MRNKARLTLCAFLGTSMALGGCSSDAGRQNHDEPGQAPAVRGATATEAVTDLVELTNVAAGGMSARAGVLDLDVVDDLLDELNAGLDGDGCVVGSLVDDDTVHLSFNSCGLDGDDVTGELDVTISAKGSGASVEFDGSVDINGCGYDGQWSVTITGASIVTSGNVELSHNGVLDASVAFNASWSWGLGNLCPDIDLSVEVKEGGSTTIVEIDNLDVCEGMCAADTVVTISADGDSVSFTPADGAIVLGSGADAVLLSCDASGDIFFEDGEAGDDSNDDPPVTSDANPRTGTWGYLSYTPIENGCGFADLFDSSGDFGLRNNDNESFTVFVDFDPFDCDIDGNDYSCPDMLHVVEDTGVATLTADGTAEGTFSGNTAASGSREVTVDCIGGDCALAETLSGASFPCTFTVSYNVRHLDDLL